MLSVAVVKPDQVELVDIPIPTPGPYEARIRSEAACLCNATDRKLIEGHFPGVEDYPLILGHETVGIVEQVGEKVRNFKVGDRLVGGLLLNSTDPDFASGWGEFLNIFWLVITMPWLQMGSLMPNITGLKCTRLCALYQIRYLLKMQSCYAHGGKSTVPSVISNFKQGMTFWFSVLDLSD